MVYREPVGVELASGVGAAVRADSSAHGLSFAPAQAEANAQQPVTCGYSKPTVAAPWKAGRFGGARLCPPARRDVTLPSQSDPFGTRAAQGNRWESACGLRRQHSQLSSLSAARAVSMEWRRDREAPPGQRAAASA